jgi:hypothetical protein
LNGFKDLYGLKQEEYNKNAAVLYDLLRETWKALVEEILFSKTIRRHGNEVQTLRLRYVTVKDEDFRNIYFGMGKCSEWMFGHDESKAQSVDRPDPKEILRNITEIEEFSNSLRKRNENIRVEREKQLKPQAAAIG